MKLVNKLICILLNSLLVTQVCSQGRSKFLADVSFNNSFYSKNIYYLSTFTPLKKNNSAGVLDSLIVLFADSAKDRTIYNYNDELSLNYFTVAAWGNDKWYDSEKHTYTYNPAGILESIIIAGMNKQSGEWLEKEKNIYKYDSSGNRILELCQYFNGQEFVNSFKYEYCYDSANNLVSSVYQLWKDNIWVNNAKTINIFNSDDLKDTSLAQVWMDNQWINSQMGIYVYDERKNIISIETKRWKGNDWTSVALGSFVFDDNDNCTIEDWMEVKGIFWVSSFRIFYEYDNDNNLVHLFGKKWEDNQWIPADEPLRVTNPDGILYGCLAKEVFLYYRKPTSVKSEKNIADRFDLLQNYPNPFNPSTTIEYEIAQPGNVKIKIYNIAGQLVNVLVNEQKNKGKFSVMWNGKDRAGNAVASGIYFYQIVSGDFIHAKKMVLLK